MKIYSNTYYPIRIISFLIFFLSKGNRRYTLFISFNIFILSLVPTSTNAQHFVEYQDSAQIDHIFDHTGFLGGGAAFFDYDNDGDDDLYMTAGDDRDHFYENNGDGTFTYKSIEAGFVVTKLYYTTGVVAGDIDNDGFKDLFITTWFSDFEPTGKNLLYKNNGDGTFTEIWNHTEPEDNTQCMGATFIDFDLDGLLDIYTISYVEDVGFLYDDEGNIIGFDHYCYRNRFYHNSGNGTFVEIAAAVDLDDNGCGLAVTATDFDLDHDMDLFLANDFGEFVETNKLFENNIEDQSFTEVGAAYNANAGIYGMGIAAGDIDNDLDLDYYVTNFGKNLLLKNDGNVFSDISDSSGAGDEWIIEDSLMAIGWGTVLLDIDNDSDLDLYVGNGYVPSPGFLHSRLYQNDKLFLNNGNLEFSDVGLDYGIENKYTTRGVSYSDYDNDGDLDILAVVENVPVNDLGWATILYQNQSGNNNNWFQATLEGVDVNRDAYGSKVYLYAGDKKILHEISGGGSHASHVSSRAHFGLADITLIDSIEVVWTGGQRIQKLYDLEVNQHIYITEDTTTAVINDIKNAVQFFNYKISPNPSGDMVNIEWDHLPIFKQGKIDIFNSVGVLKLSRQISTNINNTTIDVRDLPEGVYLMRMQYDEVIYSEKIIVQR